MQKRINNLQKKTLFFKVFIVNHVSFIIVLYDLIEFGFNIERVSSTVFCRAIVLEK